MTFSELHLLPQLLRAADEAGYQEPSPIQAQAIPPVLAGRDLMGCAQTGTGKTAAFAMPILQCLASTAPHTAARGRVRPIRALILTPTRELALQIDESFLAYGKHLPLRSCVIFGGVSQNPQVAQLRAGVDILTATPGRLNDLVGQGHIDLSHVETFVLDEADRMLDMGFVHDVKRVLSYLPKQKQTLLFSATMPREIEELAAGLLRNPAKVMVTPPATTVEAIEQSVYFVDKGNKRFLLANLLQTPAVESALVFTRTKHGADKVVRELGKDGIEARAIHGNKSQNARQDALARFKDGRIRVLVATDIAARGIDINGLSHVFNYDLPNIPETYVHRIGRTGRAGHAGIAVSFCSIDEKEYLKDIEKLIHTSIPVAQHNWPMRGLEKTETKQQTRAPRAAQNRAVPAPKPAKQQSEAKKKMETEQKKALTPAQSAPSAQAVGSQEGATPAKRRRRRGGRRHKPNGTAQPAQSAGAGQEKAPETEARFSGGQTSGRQGAGRAAAQEKSGAGAKNGANRRGARAGAGAVQENTKPQQREPQPPLEEDNSIQIISRRAPAQKFSSFDEYMKAHGSAEDAPQGEPADE